jgi:hypothetical protein
MSFIKKQDGWICFLNEQTLEYAYFIDIEKKNKPGPAK